MKGRFSGGAANIARFMRFLPRRPALRRHRGLLAILAVVLGYAIVMQALGWAQTSYYALVRGLSNGTAHIDAYHWESRDESYHDGHFYSVKAPGMPLLTLPLYKVLHAAGAERTSRWAARNAHRHRSFRWYRAGVPTGLYGNDLDRARRVRAQIEEETADGLGTGLLGVVAPAALLLLLVRALAERVEPGFGTAAAVTLGLGTLIMPFATLFFSHVLSAMLGFAAFALLWREREGPPRLALVAAAGLLAGLAVTSEYPLAIAGAIVGLYAISRGERCGAVSPTQGGVAAGRRAASDLQPLGVRFDDPLLLRRRGQGPGFTGHDVLGLNDGGFFGIGMPSAHVAVQLLFSSKGLLTLSPVLVMARRRARSSSTGAARRAEALMIGGVTLAFLVYNSGYYLPFGGGSPGPRFLIPMLPFLGVPLAVAYRRCPRSRSGSRFPRSLMAVAATVTLPMIGNGDTGYWAHVISIGSFEHTVLSVLGAGNGWVGTQPLPGGPRSRSGACAPLATPRMRLARQATARGRGRLGVGLPRDPRASRPGQTRWPDPRCASSGRCMRRRFADRAVACLGDRAAPAARGARRAPASGSARRGHAVDHYRFAAPTREAQPRHRPGLRILPGGTAGEVRVKHDGAHTEPADERRRAAVRERPHPVLELREGCGHEAASPVDQLREAVGGPQHEAAVPGDRHRQVQLRSGQAGLTGGLRRHAWMGRPGDNS